MKIHSTPNTMNILLLIAQFIYMHALMEFFNLHGSTDGIVGVLDPPLYIRTCFSLNFTKIVVFILTTFQSEIISNQSS